MNGYLLFGNTYVCFAAIMKAKNACLHEVGGMNRNKVKEEISHTECHFHFAIVLECKIILKSKSSFVYMNFPNDELPMQELKLTAALLVSK